jgi:hypothetical protein
MILIGIDPHKSTHTATAVDPATNADLGSIRIESTIIDYRRISGRPVSGRSKTRMDSAIISLCGCSLSASWWSISRPRRLLVFANSPKAAGARTIA